MKKPTLGRFSLHSSLQPSFVKLLIVYPHIITFPLLSGVSLASLTKLAIRYSPTKFFSNGITNIVRAIIMFPIPGPDTYVSTIYDYGDVS